MISQSIVKHNKMRYGFHIKSKRGIFIKVGDFFPKAVRRFLPEAFSAAEKCSDGKYLWYSVCGYGACIMTKSAGQLKNRLARPTVF